MVNYDGRLHRVVLVNDCRAKVVPLKRTTKTFTPETGAHAGQPVVIAATEEGENISPESPLEILGTYNPKTGGVRWRDEAPVAQASPPKFPFPPNPQAGTRRFAKPNCCDDAS